MKSETKLALRRWTVRQLRKLVDFADDRLHAAEVKLREEIEHESYARKHQQNSASERHPLPDIGRQDGSRDSVLGFHSAVESRFGARQLTIRDRVKGNEGSIGGNRSDSAAHDLIKSRRGKTAAEFDLRLAARALPLRFGR